QGGNGGGNFTTALGEGGSNPPGHVTHAIGEDGSGTVQTFGGITLPQPPKKGIEHTQALGEDRVNPPDNSCADVTYRAHPGRVDPPWGGTSRRLRNGPLFRVEGRPVLRSLPCVSLHKPWPPRPRSVSSAPDEPEPRRPELPPADLGPPAGVRLSPPSRLGRGSLPR